MSLSESNSLSFILDKLASSWLSGNNIDTHSSIRSDLFRKKTAYALVNVSKPKNLLSISHSSQISLSLICVDVREKIVIWLILPVVICLS